MLLPEIGVIFIMNDAGLLDQSGATARAFIRVRRRAHFQIRWTFAQAGDDSISPMARDITAFRIGVFDIVNTILIRPRVVSWGCRPGPFPVL